MLKINKNKVVNFTKDTTLEHLDSEGRFNINNNVELKAKLATVHKDSGINSKTFDGDYNFINPVFRVSSDGEVSLTATGGVIDLTEITY